jgi:CRISPR-associated protein (TIGR02584 family)
MAKTTLFFSLGNVNVLEDTIRGLNQGGKTFDKVVVFKNNEESKKVGDIIQNWNAQPDIVEMELDDLLTTKDHQSFFESVVKKMQQEKIAGHNIIVSIAGGRKTMSSFQNYTTTQD